MGRNKRLNSVPTTEKQKEENEPRHRYRYRRQGKENKEMINESVKTNKKTTGTKRSSLKKIETEEKKKDVERVPYWCLGKFLPFVLCLECLECDKIIETDIEQKRIIMKNSKFYSNKYEIPINYEMAKRPIHLFIPVIKRELIYVSIDLKQPYDDDWDPYIDLSAGKEKFKVPVENYVDEELPPLYFTYITTSLFFSRLPVYELVPICSGCFPHEYNRNKFKKLNVSNFCKAFICKKTKNVYCDGNSSVDVNEFNVLAACSSYCLCNPLTCKNQFPQGLHYPVKIVKTTNIGWDIVALSFIEADTLIMHYVGEITTRKEMVLREHEYDRIGYCNYFIETAEVDESYGDDWKIPCIDALFISNAARFLNHSCEPNVNVITIWKGDKYPSIGIFAARNIEPGEPLKYHYGINYKNMKCMCGSKNCKGYIG